jgi:hypothetical protein
MKKGVWELALQKLRRGFLGIKNGAGGSGGNEE